MRYLASTLALPIDDRIAGADFPEHHVPGVWTAQRLKHGRAADRVMLRDD